MKLSQLSQAGQYRLNIDQHQQSYLQHSYQLSFEQPEQPPLPLTFEVNTFGLGPSTTLYHHQKRLIKSKWQWQPMALSLFGRHLLDEEAQPFNHADMTTQIGFNQLINRAEFSGLALEDAQGLLKVKDLHLWSQASYPNFQLLSPQQTSWQHKFTATGVEMALYEINLSFDLLDIYNRTEPHAPLDTFSSQVNIQQLLLKQHGYPIHLDRAELDFELRADGQALSRLQNLLSVKTNNQDWQALAPLLTPGLSASISPMTLKNNTGEINLDLQLNIKPTDLEDSPLGFYQLMQNLLLTLQADADISLLEELLSDKHLGWVELAVGRGWLIRQGDKLTSHMMFKDGQLVEP